MSPTAPASAAVPAPPDFREPGTLRAHVRSILRFYEGRHVDPAGGLHHFYRDDGQVYDARTRHLVSSTRWVVVLAQAWRHFGRPRHRDEARHALQFLHQHHAQPGGGYAWTLDWDAATRSARITDGTNHAYGLAFVLLAHAHALMAGLPEAAAGLEACWQTMEQRFWQPAQGLYADEATPAWVLSDYRGQNANMHACEAMMAAFRATGDRKYLERAVVLADAVTGTLAARAAALPGVAPDCAGLVWEHFDTAWQPDPDYNRHDRSNIFRPWGFQTGHQTEWTKLLLQLDRLAPDAAWRRRARGFFDVAVQRGWDAAHGGLVYGFAPDGTVCDGDKYHWVQAESLAAAALLAISLQREGARGADEAAAYWGWYDRLWHYAWRHFVDHRHGAWYRILGADNRKLTDEKSPAGKVDYHDMGACWDVLAAMGFGAR